MLISVIFSLLPNIGYSAGFAIDSHLASGLGISYTGSVSSNNHMTSNKKHYTIGTGSIDAAYYPVGRTICEIINKQSLDFTCEAISTAGSIYNLKSIKNKTHDFGISQSIVQYHAFEGIDEFEMDGKNADLRMITPLHTEIMIIATKKGSGIKSFFDLKQKRVNIANAGSGTRIIIEKLLSHKNIDHKYFSEIHEYKSGELPDLFCNNTIDAAIYSTGHPNKIYNDMVNDCDVELISLWDNDVEIFIKNNPEFTIASIPANIYQNHNEPIKGFGILTTLSASNDIPAKHITTLLQTLKEHKQELEALHSIFKTISFEKRDIKRIAPYHDGSF